MKRLEDIILESLLDDDPSEAFGDIFPVKFKAVKKWEFPNDSFGIVFGENNQIGFYNIYTNRRGRRCATLFTTAEIRDKWIDNVETQRCGEPVPVKEIRDHIRKSFKLNQNDEILWWDAGAMLGNIDGGAVPELGDNDLGWINFIEKYQKFFGLRASTSPAKQIQFSKGIFEFD